MCSNIEKKFEPEKEEPNKAILRHRCFQPAVSRPRMPSPQTGHLRFPRQDFHTQGRQRGERQQTEVQPMYMKGNGNTGSTNPFSAQPEGSGSPFYSVQERMTESSSQAHASVFTEQHSSFRHSSSNPQCHLSTSGRNVEDEALDRLCELMESMPYPASAGFMEQTIQKPRHCNFCKRNGETEKFCLSHNLRDSEGRVECPVLRKYKCPICGATGDHAHTIKYCLHNTEHYSTVMTERTNRKSCGCKIRHWCGSKK